MGSSFRRVLDWIEGSQVQESMEALCCFLRALLISLMYLLSFIRNFTFISYVAGKEGYFSFIELLTKLQCPAIQLETLWHQTRWKNNQYVRDKPSAVSQV